jgi:hypothetical protein
MWSFPRTLLNPFFERPALVPPGAGALAPSAASAGQATPATARNALRDRYIAARFCGVARGAADLRQRDAVIKAARLYFEEERADLAVELLAIAEEELPGDPALMLARLEILFLVKDPDEFLAVAARFRETHPSHEAWPEVARLGRKLAPQATLFAAADAVKTHDHYGPWPNLPNWIRAPWDLSPEVAASDFHRAVRALAATPFAPRGLTLADGGLA